MHYMCSNEVQSEHNNFLLPLEIVIPPLSRRAVHCPLLTLQNAWLRFIYIELTELYISSDNVTWIHRFCSSQNNKKTYSITNHYNFICRKKGRTTFFIQSATLLTISFIYFLWSKVTEGQSRALFGKRHSYP